jgi:hypothetical protein
MHDGSDVIHFDGVRFISAASAAKEFGFVRDYLARLCRQGLVRGRQVGRNWYIDHRALQQFFIQQAHRKELAREELRRERRVERASAQAAPPQKFRNAPATRAANDPSSDLRRAVIIVPPGGFHALARTALERAQTVAHTPSAHALAHAPTYALSPLAEFLHKVAALMLAVMLTFGTYALVDPQYARFAATSVSDALATLPLAFNDIGRISHDAQTQVALAADNPGAAVARLSSAASDLARAFNAGINQLVYAIAFPSDLIRSKSDTGSVAVQIEPYAARASSTPHSRAASPSITQTIINNPVVERVIVERAASGGALASSGGITQELLDKKIQELDAKLSSRILSSSVANSTQITNVYQSAASVARIDHLDALDLTNPTISGARITDTHSLSVTGDTTLATTTINGDLAVSGTITPAIVSTTAFTATNATTTNATSTNHYISNLVAATASTTNLTWTNAAGTNSTSTNQFASAFVASNATTTNLFSTNASTTNATSTTFFSVLSNFTTGIINTLTATIATITNLTATNLIATNATSTNATSTNSFVSNLSAVTASSTNLTAVNATTTNSTSTSSFATTASSTNLFSTAAAVGTLTAGNATSTNFFSTNASTTNATSTNMFSVFSHFTTSIIDTLTATIATITNLTATNLVATNATTTNATSTNSFNTNLVATNATTTNLFSTNASTTNSTSTNQYASAFVALNATSTNLFSTNASTTNATSTIFFSGLGHLTTGIIDTLTATIATITNLTATNVVATNATTTNATTTNLTVFTAAVAPSFIATSTTASVFPYASSTALTATQLFSTNFQTLGSTTLQNFTALNSTSTSFFATTFQATNSTSTNSFATTASSTNLFAQTAALGTLTAGTLSLNAALSVANGGTGWSTINSNTVLLGNGTGAVSTTTRGSLTETGSSILTITGGTNATLGAGTSIQVAQAGSAAAGFLSAADWSKFNSATTTFNNGITYSAGTAGLTSIAANSILANITGASGVPTALATSSLFSLTGATTIAYASSTALTATNLFSTYSSTTNITASGSSWLATAGGSVGIGTTSPLAKLHVEGTGQIIRGYGTNTAAATYALIGAGTGNGLYWGQDSSSGGSLFTGGLANAAALGTGNATALQFATNNSVRATIDPSGNVGIGTTSPASLLTLSGSSAKLTIEHSSATIHDSTIYDDGNFHIEGNGNAWINSGNTGATFINTGGGVVGINTSSVGSNLSVAGNVSIGTYNATAAPSNGFIVSGNVGIGLTNPSTALSVSGVSRFARGNSIQFADLPSSNVRNLASFLSSADTIQFGGSDNGGQAPVNFVFTPNSGGGVGIGTTTPQAPLSVFSSGGSTLNLDFNSGVFATKFTRNGQVIADIYKNASGPLSFDTYATQSTNAAFDFEGGNVGIGSTSPTQKLSVVDAGNSNQLSGTFGVFANNLTQGVGIGYAGIAAVGSNTNQDLSINAKGTGNVTLQAGGLSTGNVGIGTASPAEKLDVLGSGTVGFARFANTDYVSGSVGSGLLFSAGATSGNTYSQISAFNAGFSAWNNLVLQAGGGNVGIGTTNPADTLEVNGIVRATGFKTPALSTGVTPVYIRGTGINHSANALIQIGGTTVVNTGSRGLTLTIVTASTQAVVSSTNYDTCGSTANSDNLATALNNLQRSQIGIMVSFDALECNYDANLKNAALRLGLYKLAGVNTAVARHPYAAIFYGSGTGTGNTQPNNQAVEVMQSDDANAPYAIINSWLTQDGFEGQNLTNALVSGDSSATSPAVFVNGSGQVGIGTASPTFALDVRTGASSNVADFNQTGASQNTDIYVNNVGSANNFLVTRRSNGESWLYNSGTDPIAFYTNGTNRMQISGTGNIGIGTTSPGSKLDIASSFNQGLRLDNGSNYFNIFNDGNAHIESAVSSTLWINGDNNAPTNINHGGGTTSINDNGGSVGVGTNNSLALLTVGNAGAGATNLLPAGSNTGFGKGVFADSDTSAFASKAPTLTLLNTAGNNGITDLLFATYNNNGSNVGTAALLSGTTTTSGSWPGGYLAFQTSVNGSGNTERMRIDASGNVGIGTTGPGSQLHVYGAGQTTSSAFSTSGATGGTLYLQDSNGGAGNGGAVMFGASQGAFAAIKGNLNDGSSNTNGNLIFALRAAPADSTLTTRMSILSNGNVGIASTTPWQVLSVEGGVAFHGLATGAGNGSLCLSTAGLVSYDSGANCITSSQRFKNSIVPLDATSGLAEVLALNPVSFRYNQGAGDSGAQEQVGFIAEQVNTVDPRLVVFDASNTPYSVKYQNLTAILAGAVRAQQGELNALLATSSASTTTPEAQSFASSFVSNLFARVTTWLADASNGIHDLYAKIIHASEVHAKEFCAQKSDGGEVCVTGDQLAALLSAAGASQSPESVASSASSNPTPNPPISATSSSPKSDASTTAQTATSNTPPIIQINGSNPAVIQVGDTYADLGATITGPQADLNLGIKTFLNGALVSNIVIDTSAAATDTIAYVATDAAGNTATSTRTVIVRAPASADSAAVATSTTTDIIATTSSAPDQATSTTP